MQICVLVVDDEAGVRYTLKAVFEEAGYEVLTASGGEDALAGMAKRLPDVVITDLAMPRMDGMTLLQRIHDQWPALPVLMVTAHGSERKAVEAMKYGAWDYLTKPFDIDELVMSVQKVCEHLLLHRENEQLRAQLGLSRPILYRSAAMTQCLTMTHRVAKRDVTVLITGDTGTGKELIASAIHELSTRSHKPMVSFNAAALPEGVAGSELFGHEKGAFTGAVQSRDGLFSQADGGILFLDEIGDLPMALQAKLLRVIQEGEFLPLGATKPRRVDVRLLAATHRDLRAEIEAGRFREDLFYRINVVELRLPSLGERREDIDVLLAHFFAHFKGRFGLPGLRIAPEVLADLRQRAWPGNVRELEHAVERLVAMSDGIAVTADDLQFLSQSSGASEPSGYHDETLPLRQRVAAFEAAVIEQALERHDQNRSATARALHISRVTLLDKMAKYQLR